jgi:L-fuculose-phosphate aldolase
VSLVTPGEREAFEQAGRSLAAHGLVHESEGNLSSFDGGRLTITRTGCILGSLREGDVLEGTLDVPPADASSDLAVHVALYRERGPGAVAHAHPAGTVPAGWVEGQGHGVYVFAGTIVDAVGEIVARHAGRGA